MGDDARFRVDDLLDARQEPRIDLAGGVDLLVVDAEPHGLRHLEQPLGRRHAEPGADHVLVVAGAEAFERIVVEPAEPGFQTAQRLLQALGERAPDRHHLAHRFHRGRQRALRARELLEGEAGDLGDDVVDGGLERGRRGAARDVVLQLVQRVADGELGGDLGDGKARRLRCQRGRARHARVHLDDDEAAVVGIDGELHVRAARLHADLAQHRDRGVAHDLVFFVGQRQRRRHRDAVAGVHAHRVDVLDRADDDAVVRLVADHLHLEFLPAEHALLDQHLGGRRGLQAALDDLAEFLAVVGDAAAGAAERERRPDDGRQPDDRQPIQGLLQRLFLIALLAVVFIGAPLLQEIRPQLLFLRRRHLQAVDAREFRRVVAAILLLELGRIGQHRLGRGEADARHGIAEQLAVLGHVDGLGLGADHLHAELFQHALLGEAQRGVERGLAAHGRQQRVGPLLLDDLGDEIGRDRLDIGCIGQVRVRHDRGRIGVDQDDAVALGLQRLAGLGAGIVELAGLPDDDGARADDEDGFDICALRHKAASYCSATAWL